MARAFTFHEIEGEDESPQETVDLVSLMDGKGKPSDTAR